MCRGGPAATAGACRKLSLETEEIKDFLCPENHKDFRGETLERKTASSYSRVRVPPPAFRGRMGIIKLEGLTKKFGELTAVDNISLEVNAGELFGILGPNGAGKTTTISMLSTLLKPTSGNAEIAGLNLLKESGSIRFAIGIVFQEPALDSKLTGYENLDFHSCMYGLSKETRKQRIREVLALIELSDKADILVENYSGGMKRRLEIARALIHKPKILFLDEPTLGLDAQTRRHIWEYIKRLNEKEHVTVILTTHYMEEADYLCNRIAIVDHGKIVSLDTPQNLKNMVASDIISLDIPSQGVSNSEFFNAIKSLRWVKGIKWSEGELKLNVSNGEMRIPRIISLAHRYGIFINAVNLHKPSLEDVFLRLTGKTIREEEAGQPERVPENRPRIGL